MSKTFRCINNTQVNNLKCGMVFSVLRPQFNLFYSYLLLSFYMILCELNILNFNYPVNIFKLMVVLHIMYFIVFIF